MYFKIREEPERFPGVEVVEQSVRSYPQGRLGAHLVGWVGQINAEELERPRFSGTGPPISSARRASRPPTSPGCGGAGSGAVPRELGRRGAPRVRSPAREPGHDLRLALDLDVQRIAEEELQAGIERARSVYDESSNRGLEANAGAVVVLDADTGGIVAMASWPTFRPAVVRGLTEAQRFQLFESERAPMLNRATQITYAPGSTFKPFVALAAVKEGFASLGGYYDCPAEYVHPGDESGALFHNWDGTGAGAVDRRRSPALVRHAVLRMGEPVLQP